MKTKGKMITELKARGIRRTPEGKKLESVKTFEIINLYFGKGSDINA